jgi:hypothetical protein
MIYVCVYVCIHIYTYVYTYTHTIYIYIYIYIHHFFYWGGLQQGQNQGLREIDMANHLSLPSIMTIIEVVVGACEEREEGAGEGGSQIARASFRGKHVVKEGSNAPHSQSPSHSIALLGS